MCKNIETVHTYFRQGEDGTWCLSNIKVTRILKLPTLSVYYHAFRAYYCSLFYALFASAEQW